MRRRSSSAAWMMRARELDTSSAASRSLTSRNTTTAPRPSGVAIGDEE